MLNAVKRISHAIEAFTLENNAAVFSGAYGKLRLVCAGRGILRATATLKKDFLPNPPDFIVKNEFLPIGVNETADAYIVKADGISANVDKVTGIIAFFDENDKPIAAENGLRTFEAFNATQVSRVKPMEYAEVDTPDGKKRVVTNATREYYKTLYRMRLPLKFSADEGIYGLGQQEHEPLNLRNSTVWNCQHNRAIALPFMVSTKGYGILLSTGSPFKFVGQNDGGYFYIEAGDELDYYVIAGGMKQAISGYRKLTGAAVLLPRWAYGYIQSQEAYETGAEMVEIAKGCRERGIGVDCIVEDWNSWEPGKWGQKTVDKQRFPDLKALTDELHGLHAHMMLSIWPNMANGTDNNSEFKKENLLLAGSDAYDAMDPKARAIYWKQANDGLFSQGLDAWWCDSSEPWTPEWSVKEVPEESEIYYRYLSTAFDLVPPEKSNMFAFYHGTTMSEGQRSAQDKKRVCNLTRSAWAGQQRLGCIMWSGDISATWATLKDQIAVGQNFCASGIPYWTLDIGGFFIKKGASHFWNGDYDEGWNDPEFCELYTRWYQYGAFLPVFRAHGTDFRREMWNLTGENYDAVFKANRERYKLLPYIYSLAGNAWLNGGTLMTPVAFCFPDDKNTYNLDDQFMLGDALMVCPVTEYGARSRNVYLPKGVWYDRNTGKKYEGGTVITADAPIDAIPVFVRAGSIIPEFEPALSTEEAWAEHKLSLRTYPGADGEFTLYEDSGDGFGYEKGEYSLTKYIWHDKEEKLEEIKLK